MKKSTSKAARLGILFTACVLAQQATAQQADRITELERKVELLSRQVEQTTFGSTVAPVGDSTFGMGAAASKVYHQDTGISLGGYGEAIYEDPRDGTATADFLRAVLYFGYKYTDRWVLNTEIEFEHASTSKEGSASVEFAYIDYLHSELINFRAGLLLIPVGIVNELHEPTAYLSARRPEIESRIIPTTWRENGIGIFGTVQGTVDYKAYVVNGLQGEKFSDDGLRGGRQKGSKALAEDLAAVVRIDVRPREGLTVGGSVYAGDSGHDLGVAVGTRLYEGHLLFRQGGLTLNALATLAEVDDVAALNRLLADTGTPDSAIASIGERLTGWYVELGYDLFNAHDTGERSLTPYVRISEFNTQDKVPAGFAADGATDREVLTIGLNFKPLDEIVFKADVQLGEDAAGGDTEQFNLAMGYVF